MSSILYTFWDFLGDNNVVIPIIQRDYAQGREGKSSLRINFLGQLKEALLTGTNTVLDFVYGTVENGRLYPLDGQQRLTTLWLLHWYFAYRSGALHKNTNVKERLLKFSYQTRQSSEDFCKNLCSLPPILNEQNISLKRHITNQTWFYSTFYLDPTISSMLRMLSNSDGDSIESLFNELNPASEYWSMLTDCNKCPIHFYHKGMQDENMPLTDDLYIKMNARGKRLTEFENFKAEFFEYKIPGENKLFDLETDSESFISRFENEWTNVFWRGHRHPQLNRIDEIYLKFINRYALNYYITHADKATDLNKTELFKHLYNGEEFTGIKVYAPILNSNFKESLRETLNGIVRVLPFCDGNPNTLFNNQPIIIPDYSPVVGDSSIKLTSISPRERVLLYGACSYFEKIGRGEEFKFLAWNDWMRFVGNISANPNVDGPELYISAIRVLSQYASHATDIVNFLAEQKLEASSQVERQIKEEIEKAKYIQSLRNNGLVSSDKLPTEEDIYEAERFRFFKGSIRFLFRNEVGETDWISFRAKFLKARSLFEKQDNKDNRSRILRIVLRNFVFRVNKWDSLREIVFDSTDEQWKQILTNERLIEPVHLLLTEPLLDDTQLKRESSPLELLRGKVHRELFATDFLEYTTWEPFILREDYNHENYYMAPYNAKAEWKHYYIGTDKNNIITRAIDDGLIEFLPNQNRRIYNSSFCWGYYIPFTYQANEKSYVFRWDLNRLRLGKYDAYGNFTELKEGLWRDASRIASQEEFIQLMNDLIATSE